MTDQPKPSTLEARRRRIHRDRYPDAPREGRCSHCNGLCEVRTVHMRVPTTLQLLALRTTPDAPVERLLVEGLYCHPCAHFHALSPGHPSKENTP